jgi:hypothetical protein
LLKNTYLYIDKAKGNLVSIPEPGDGTALFNAFIYGCIVEVTQKDPEKPLEPSGRVFFSA